MAIPTTTQKFKRYPWTDVTASPYNCDNTGATDISTGLAQIKADQSNVGTIRFPAGTYKISSNVTIPAGMLIDMNADAVFSVDTGKVLTLGVEQAIHASWFGSDAAAINHAIDSCSTANKTLVIGEGSWSIDVAVSVPSTVLVVFEHGVELDIDVGISFTIAGKSIVPVDVVNIGSGTLKYGVARITGSGSPESAVYAKTGSSWYRTDTTTEPLLYIKVSGDNTATGWLGVYTDGAYVHDTGNETIAGVKTFSSFPILPSSNPTTDYQAAHKAYVDAVAGAGGLTFAVISDTKAQNTPGGTAVATTWTKRALNTEDSDASAIVTIASDEFTLAAGTYYVRAVSPFAWTGYTKLRLYNITDSSVVAYGPNGYVAGYATMSTTNMVVEAIFTIAGSKAIAVQYYVTSGGYYTYELGPVLNLASISEMYTTVFIIKLA